MKLLSLILFKITTTSYFSKFLHIKLILYLNFNSIQFLRINQLGNGHSAQRLLCLVLPQYLSFSDFPCIQYWPTMSGYSQACYLPSFLGWRTVSLPTLGQIQPRSGNEKGENHPVGCHAFACPTHTYHRFGLSVELLWTTSALVYQILAAYFTTHAFQVVQLPVPILNYPLLVIQLSFLFSQPRGVVKTPTTLGEISTSRKVATCLLFIYPHRGPFPPPYMGSSVGVLCTGYRQPLTVLVTFLVLACFSNSSDQNQKFNSLLRGIKSGL